MPEWGGVPAPPPSFLTRLSESFPAIMTRGVDFHSELSRWGCGQKLGLVSCHEAKISTVLDRTAPAEGQLDTRLVKPANVAIDLADELVDRESSSIPRVEELDLQPAEEAFAGGIVL